MGSNWSQFKKSIEKGNEKKCLDIYNKYSSIRKKLDANSVINELTLDSYIHMCAKNGMVELLKLFLNENNGNPNSLNRDDQNILHKCCDGRNDAIQYECLQVIFKWVEEKRVNSKDDSVIELNINEQDIYNNTPLHYAAKRNLSSCVQTLVSNGAFLFVENKDRFTPFDLAEQCSHKDIALYLESKMIFSKEENEQDSNLDEIFIPEEKQNYGLRPEDLYEEKSKLLLETSEMLQCDVFTAETMLKKHSWSKDLLLNSWMQDPIKCCENCGITNSEIEDFIKLSKTKKTKNSFKVSHTQMENNKLFLRNESFKNLLNSNSTIIRKTSGRNFNKKASISLYLPVNDITTQKKQKITKPISSIEITNNQNYELDFDFYNKNAHSKTDPSGMCSLSELSTDLVCGICFCDFNELSQTNKKEIVNDDLNNSVSPSISFDSTNNESNEFYQIICGHKFCKSCWEQYLTLKIREGNVSDIMCPQVNCYAILSNEIIGLLVSKEMARRHSQFDIQKFVDSNPNIKWCPFPGCGMAVKNPKIHLNTTIHKKVIIPGIHEQHNVVEEFSIAVDCGQGHIFCWDCLKEGHEPATCQNWKDWYDKILEVKPEELSNTNEKEELTANYLWLVTNSKKCPNTKCSSPIQKNEGCNHVKCYKCKYEFCWLCMEPWKKHSGSTGGYFQCNRYEVTNKIVQKTKQVILEAGETHLKAVESNKFAHYYTRFKNHENSYKIEEPLLNKAKTKFEILSFQDSNDELLSTKNASNSLEEFDLTLPENTSLSSFQKYKQNKAQKDLENSQVLETLIDSKSKVNNNYESPITAKNDEILDFDKIESLQLEKASKSVDTVKSASNLFIEEAIRELLKARSILRCSYVYGYYLDQYGHKKFIFEYIQTEFEESTENLSQIIARLHLNTPKNKIIRLTNVLRRKRIEFLETIRNGLNSFQETPPNLKKHSLQRWKYLLKDNIQHDEEFKQTVAINLKELNPKNPWIIDKKGRHTNLLALLNDSPELENELDEILMPSKVKYGICSRWNCTNLKSVNTLSGSICNYCSIKCMRIDRNNYLEKKINSKEPENNTPDKNYYGNPTTSENVKVKSKDENDNKSVWKNLKTRKKNSNINLKKDSDKKISSLTHKNLNKKLEKCFNEESQSKDDLMSNNDFFKFNKDNSIEIKNQSYNYSAKNTTSQYLGSNKEIISNNKSEYSLLPTNQSNDIFEQKADMEKANDRSNISKNYFASIPFESLFLNKNENDISYIIKNMENVLYDQNESKIEKVCNFQIQVKK